MMTWRPSHVRSLTDFATRFSSSLSLSDSTAKRPAPFPAVTGFPAAASPAPELLLLLSEPSESLPSDSPPQKRDFPAVAMVGAGVHKMSDAESIFLSVSLPDLSDYLTASPRRLASRLLLTYCAWLCAAYLMRSCGAGAS